jgi:hypothetical protein
MRPAAAFTLCWRTTTCDGCQATKLLPSLLPYYATYPRRNITQYSLGCLYSSFLPLQIQGTRIDQTTTSNDKSPQQRQQRQYSIVVLGAAEPHDGGRDTATRAVTLKGVHGPRRTGLHALLVYRYYSPTDLVQQHRTTELFTTRFQVVFASVIKKRPMQTLTFLTGRNGSQLRLLDYVIYEFPAELRTHHKRFK